MMRSPSPLDRRVAICGDHPSGAFRERSGDAQKMFRANLSVASCTFSVMEFGNLTDDELDEIVVGAEAGVAQLRALETAAIAEMQARKTHLKDGYRSIVDWVAARADVSHKTARSLCWTASRLTHAPEGLLPWRMVSSHSIEPNRYHGFRKEVVRATSVMTSLN